MRRLGPSLLLLTFVAGVGCGPPSPPGGDDEAGVDAGESESSSSTTTSTTSTTSTTTTESSESEGESEGAATTFVPPTDFTVPASCDPWAQDCVEGEKCVAYASTGEGFDAVKCVPVLGDQAPGEPCSYDGMVEATDDCDANSYCWDVEEVDGGQLGTCAAFCGGTPDDPTCPDPPGCARHSCLFAADGSINLCVPDCDPLAQDCGPGEGCYWVQNRFQCLFGGPDLPEGEPCGFVNDCPWGSICVAAEELPDCAGQSCCAPFCDTAVDFDPCPGWKAGTACAPFDTGQDDCSIGVCLLP